MEFCCILSGEMDNNISLSR